MNGRTIVKTTALLGFVASAVGASVHLAGTVGYLPAPLFHSIALWDSGVSVWIPVESVVCLWFAALVLTHWREWPEWATSRWHATYLSATIAAGICVWVVAARAVTLPMSVAALAAVTILLAAGVSRDWWPAVRRDVLISDLRRLWSPGGRSAVVTAFALVVAVVSLVRVAITATPPAEARVRNLRRWYLERKQTLDDGTRRLLSTDRGARIVVFTSYAWQPFRSNVNDRASQVDTFRRAGLPTDFIVRQFPLDPSCNKALRPPLMVSDAACDAARAIKFMDAVAGSDAGTQLGLWLYARAPVLTTPLIYAHLDRLGYLNAFREAHDEWTRLVSDDIALAERLRVRAVPTYFINGVSIHGSVEAFDAVLSLELEHFKVRQQFRSGR